MKLSFKIIKKIWVSLFLLAAFLIPIVTQAQQNPPPVYRYLSFLRGYNVNVTNNAGAIGPFSTNVLWTTVGGQAVYSYTNTGTATNTGDAFNSFVRVQADANGVIQSNVTLWLIFGETNWIPQTNLSGIVTNWPLQNSMMGSTTSSLNGTANVYPAYGAQDTNFVTVTLSRAALIQPQGNDLDGAATVPQFETTPGYSQTITMIAPTLLGVVTNFVIPNTFLNGASYVRFGITSTNTAGSAHGVGTLLNAAGIFQPQQ